MGDLAHDGRIVAFDEQREVLTDIIQNEFIPFQRQINFCNDKRTLEKFEVTDKNAPGIYVMNQEESAVIQEAEGGATNEWIKTKVDAEGAKLVDQFSKEAKELVKANPPGSSDLEKTDCSKFAPYFARYVKGHELVGVTSRK